MTDLLTRLGWSQKYFAEKAGVSVNTVNNWCKKERGHGYNTAMKLLELYCRINGV